MKYLGILNDVETIIEDESVEKLDLVSTGYNKYHVLYNHMSYDIEVLNFDVGLRYIELLINGVYYKVFVKNQTDLTIANMGLDRVQIEKQSELISPMPGKVLDIIVSQDDEVQSGDPLIILEAMKMENVLKASAQQKIKHVRVEVGETVTKHQVLLSYY